MTGRVVRTFWEWFWPKIPTKNDEKTKKIEIFAAVSAAAAAAAAAEAAFDACLGCFAGIIKGFQNKSGISRVLQIGLRVRRRPHAAPARSATMLGP